MGLSGPVMGLLYIYCFTLTLVCYLSCTTHVSPTRGNLKISKEKGTGIRAGDLWY
jgi:hypothetical protein